MTLSMYFRRVPVAAIAIAAALLLSSCATSKQVRYFQNIDEVRLHKLSGEYQAKIKKDDMLTIVVSGPDKTVTAPYNLTLGEMGNGMSSGNPESSTLSYLVGPDGCINFPILGLIHVEGMTRQELTEYLTSEIRKDVKDPIVYVSFRNYKVTVLGEVKSPGTYYFDSEKVNILQALGRAGDLSITALRKDIIIVREENNRMEHYTIDLRDAHVLESPNFFLQQNDIIYVPPRSTRIASANAATGLWSTFLSSISTILAIVAFLR